MEKSRKVLNKSSKSNNLSTYYNLLGSCSACGPCGCSCSAAWASVATTGDAWIIEQQYRNAVSNHT
jgi:hypothetical protein